MEHVTCGRCDSFLWHLLPLVYNYQVRLRTEEITTAATARRAKLIIYIASLAYSEYHRLMMFVVETAVGGWCAHFVCGTLCADVFRAARSFSPFQLVHDYPYVFSIVYKMRGSVRRT